MSRPAPNAELLDTYRRRRADLPPLQNLYPYAMGRIEQCLSSEAIGPKARIAMALMQIDALDIVSAEPMPERQDPPECPHSPNGRHQVDTSMESGPNNCFHCEAPMGRR
jgi:hypothetical protein